MTAIRVLYPISANRYWQMVRTPLGTRIALTSAAHAYKAAVAQACVAAYAQPFTADVEVWLRLHPRTTKAGAASKTRIDLDNCIKVAIDACQGKLYANDRQIVRLHAEIAEPVADGALSVACKPIVYQD